MTKILFVTGTDTEVGKTYVSCKILENYNAQGCTTIGLKPIASDCNEQDEQGRWLNQDVLALQQASSIKLPYEQHNAYAFQEPIAPHIAAQLCNQTIDLDKLIELTFNALRHKPDVLLVEGFGGWLPPINDESLMIDYVKEIKADVVMVVGMKLGCLNHALLTAQAIRSSGLKLEGWVANKIDPNMKHIEENIETLKQWLSCPMLLSYDYAPNEKELA